MLSGRNHHQHQSIADQELGVPQNKHCSRCKLAAPQDSFPFVKRAPTRLQSSKSERSYASKTPTPYRLPRLSRSSLGFVTPPGDEEGAEPGEEFEKEQSDGLDGILMKREREPLSPSSLLSLPPYTIAQQMRASNIHMPTFKHAQFLPVDAPRPRTDPELIVAKFNIPTQMNDTPSRLAPGDHPPYVGRHGAGRGSYISSAASSPLWRLSPYNHTNYDNQSLGGASGPYSREFRVHCTTPKSWLQMKWSRERSSL